MVVALAATAGAALVQAMVTDGWEGVRHRVARLFGRGQDDPAIERRLDATRGQLSAAAPGDLEKVRASLAGQWETRFSDLLADHPEALRELVALVEDLRVMAPVTAADHAVAAGRDVNVTAEGGSVAAAVIHGTVAPPGPTVPGPARG